jgi:Big-like domain-containing protein
VFTKILTVRLILFATIVLGVLVRSAVALPSSAAPPLPPPTGIVVNVASEAQLQQAVRTLQSGTTIMLAPGIYTLTATLSLSNVNDVALRGSTANRDDVVLQGPGMNVPTANLLFGVWSANVQGLLIANLTIRDFRDHPIILNSGTQSPHIYNTRLVNAGQQFIKSNPDGLGGGVNNGIVEYTIMEYSTTSRDNYTNGVDVIHGINWIIRHNLFRNIRAPLGQLAGPSVLMWKGSQNTLTEGNTFINCQRGIAYGLVDQPGFDHSGGIIRNNFFYRGPGQSGDVGIMVFDSPSTKVLHNTVILSGTYINAIEYRFPDTTGVLISNNLVDANITARTGGVATLSGNETSAFPGMFVNPAAADLHLLPTATLAIDRVSAVQDALTDWDNQARPQGFSADVGADESTSSTPPPVNVPPTVTLTAPAPGTVLTAPAIVTVSATASDVDGLVAQVAFYAGTILIGTDTTAPYSISVSRVPAQVYSITAVATDDRGAKTTSLPVTVTVQP